MENNMKKFSCCKQEKSEEQFSKDNRYKDGLFCYCKSCGTKKRLEWRKKHNEKDITNSLQRKYGITYEDKLALIEKQNHKCAICSEPILKDNQAHLDHCHKTNRIRGVLCNGCNTGIGLLKDSIVNLESAIKYLKG